MVYHWLDVLFQVLLIGSSLLKEKKRVNLPPHLKCAMSSCMQMNTEIKDALLNYAHDHNNQTIHAYKNNDKFIKYARIVDNSQCTKRNIAIETLKRLLLVCVFMFIL